LEPAADGYEQDMSAFNRAADHAMGLELQIEELTEQRQRALSQHRDTDAVFLAREITQLQAELALTAEVVATQPPTADPEPVLHDTPDHAVGGES
jgi:hypothetical protein